MGGEGFGYTLLVETVTASPVPVTPPLNREAGTLPAGDPVVIYSFTGSAGAQVAAEAWAGRLAVPSDVDTALVLVDVTNPSTPVVLAENDDIDAPAENYDSKINATTLTTSGTHWLVLDPYVVTGNARNFEIDLSVN